MYRVYILFVLVFTLITAQPAFTEENPLNSTHNTNERQPFYAPGMCPENQLIYPDQVMDWVCDCAPRFLYYPPKDMCYHAYKQGPCKTNEYLLLKEPELNPKCLPNPCMNDTMVPFNGKCLRLHKTNGCPPLHFDGGTLEVNPLTLQLECASSNATELNIIKFPNIPCPSGSKRNASGRCRKVFK